MRRRRPDEAFAGRGARATGERFLVAAALTRDTVAALLRVSATMVPIGDWVISMLVGSGLLELLVGVL